MTGSVAKLTGPRPWVSGLACALVLGVPLLDWTLVSGMEAAFVSALIGRAVVAVERATQLEPHLRDAGQLRAGVWLAAVAVGRPECIGLAAALAIAIAHGAGSRSLWRSLARATLPIVFAVGGLMIVNAVATGEASASGAVRKLVTHDPYWSPADAALAVAVNALRLYTVGFEVALGGTASVVALAGLAIGSALARSTRRLGLPLILGAIASFVLVTLNKTAPFQNLRYIAPTLLMLLVAAGLGVRAAALKWRRAGLLVPGAAALILACAAPELAVQTDHYARSARNIDEQQVEVGERIARMDPLPRRVFVGDAGAISYVSDRPALDGLGLGGFRDLPFARASVHGIGAVVELIERLDPKDRPDVLAIYDAWWPDLGKHFGERAFSVRIEDNVMCADPEKVVYRADWSLLEDRATLENGALFRLDIGDLVDEKWFGVELPRPHGGYVTQAALVDSSGRRRYDAQRLLAEGQSLSFAIPHEIGANGTMTLSIQSSSQPETPLRIEWAGRSTDATVGAHDDASWGQATVVLQDVRAGERIVLTAAQGSVEIGAITGAKVPLQ
ncbi:MAG: hypothetical protein HOW73_26910 [Polyangiaceae bacterium]|nr:hypothetical protein [Polyangiaceae bacterium]